MRPRRALLVAALAALPALPAVAQGDPSFSLLNRSGQTINEIYVSPVSEPNWGRDLLGSEVLPSGRAFPVRIPPRAGCRQDVRVVYGDGRPEERRNVDTCSVSELVFPAAAVPPRGSADAANPSFNIVNHGGLAIREVYVSSARDANWGQQRLVQPLQPGAHLPVSLPVSDCVNDVRVVWNDGRREDRRQVDTCRLVNLVFQ
jgi:hypothetical protein